MSKETRRPGIQFRAPEALEDAIAEAARANNETKTEFCMRAVLARLRGRITSGWWDEVSAAVERHLTHPAKRGD